MRLDTGWSEFDADDARLRGYFARPAAAAEALPIAILIQEVWGVDEHIRDLAERVASCGYHAFAPDLHSRDARPELAPERVAAAKAFLDTLPPGGWTDELARNVVHALRDRTACLMGSHGAVTIGPDLMTAQDRSTYLEWLCDVYLRATSAGTPRLLSSAQLAAVAGKIAGYGQQAPAG